MFITLDIYFLVDGSVTTVKYQYVITTHVNSGAAVWHILEVDFFVSVLSGNTGYFVNTVSIYKLQKHVIIKF